MDRPQLLRADRERSMEHPFGWVPFRFLREGFCERLSAEAKLFYFFLCLVADRRGVSFYGDARVGRILCLSAEAVVSARAELRANDLLAYGGGVYQVLSLPRKVEVARETRERVEQSDYPSRSEAVEHIRDILRRLG